MKIFAFIPARAGSTRTPSKNIKLLNSRPLISYTIAAAKKSKHINRIVVSTDSQEIANISKEYGAEIPFLRPSEISQFDSTELQFFEHVLNWLWKNEKYKPDLIVLLYPTSPFRTSNSIDKAIETILKHPEADSLRSVRLCSEHPYKMWVEDNNYIKPFVDDKNSNTHTLSYKCLPTIYIQNASIYITRPSTIKDKKSSVGDIVVPFVMNEIESIDINTPLDFDFAEMIMKNRRN